MKNFILRRDEFQNLVITPYATISDMFDAFDIDDHGVAINQIEFDLMLMAGETGEKQILEFDVEEEKLGI